MKNTDNDSYYYRYKKQSRKFEMIGLGILAVGLLISRLSGQDKLSPLNIIVIAAGLFFLVVGGSSSRPHMVVRSFASLLSSQPTTKNAKEFIEALNSIGNVRLVKQSQNMVWSSVAIYEHSEDSNPEVVKELKEALERHIKTQVF